ncbi:hypothetical protein JCM11251_001486 [Rhodosporidiobolus azoricus]
MATLPARAINSNSESSEDSQTRLSQLSQELQAAYLEIDHLRLVNSQLVAALGFHRPASPPLVPTPSQEPPTPLSPSFPRDAAPSAYPVATQPGYSLHPLPGMHMIESYDYPPPPPPPPINLSFLPPAPPLAPQARAPTSYDFLPPPSSSSHHQRQHSLHVRATSLSALIGVEEGGMRVNWAAEQAHGRTASWP